MKADQVPLYPLFFSFRAFSERLVFLFFVFLLAHLPGLANGRSLLRGFVGYQPSPPRFALLVQLFPSVPRWTFCPPIPRYPRSSQFCFSFFCVFSVWVLLSSRLFVPPLLLQSGWWLVSPQTFFQRSRLLSHSFNLFLLGFFLRWEWR